ncbi:MAG: hypothetical protein RSE52_08215, partial [Erysipelotrichaceae bacterium]
TFSISLVPTTVHAAEELYVNGENISLTPDKEITAGKGYIKYDAKSNTVELNNATIDKTYDYVLISKKTAGDLNISLKGTNQFIMNKQNNSGMKIAINLTDGNLNITGVGEKPT